MLTGLNPNEGGKDDQPGGASIAKNLKPTNPAAEAKKFAAYNPSQLCKSDCRPRRPVSHFT